MAEFTANLPAAPQISGGGSPGSGTTAGAIGGILGGLADISSLAINKLSSDKGKALQAGAEKDLTDLVQKDWGSEANPNAGKIVGEGTGDPVADAAATNPVVKDATGQLQTLAQAHAQGNVSPQELMTRASVIVQDAITANPLHSQEIRQAAQNVLGMQPTVELVRLAEQKANTQEALNADVTKTNVMAAVGAGITYLTPDGTVDVDKMSTAGSTVMFGEKQMKDELAAAQLAAAGQAPALTHDQTIDAQVTPAITAMNPVFEKVSHAMLDSVPALINKLANAGDDDKIAGITQAIGVQKTTFLAWMNGQAVKNNIGPDALAKLQTYYSSQFDNYKTLITGDLSSAGATAALLAKMSARGQIELQKTAPMVAALKRAGGDQAVAAAINVAAGTDTNLRQKLGAEISSFILEPHQQIGLTADALSGKYNVAAEQNPQTQRQVLASVVGSYNSYTQNPDKLDATSTKAFGHASIQIGSVGVQSNDPDNIRQAASLLSSPGAIRAYNVYAKDGNNAAQLPVVTQAFLATNVKNLNRNLPILAQGETMQGVANASPFTGQSQNGSTLTGLIGDAAQSYTARASSYFNPVTGKIEMSIQAVDQRGKPYSLSPGEMQQATSQFAGYAKQVGQMNQSLDAAVAVKDNSMGREKELSAMEFKQLLTSGSGFPNKPGTKPVPPPKFLEQAQPAKGSQTPGQQASNEGGSLYPDNLNLSQNGSGGPQGTAYDKTVDSKFSALLPGSRITSGPRSQADNKRVGGTSNSAHLADRARDIVPPSGISLTTLAEVIRLHYPKTKVVVEAAGANHSTGPHVHVEWTNDGDIQT